MYLPGGLLDYTWVSSSLTTHVDFLHTVCHIIDLPGTAVHPRSLILQGLLSRNWLCLISGSSPQLKDKVLYRSTRGTIPCMLSPNFRGYFAWGLQQQDPSTTNFYASAPFAGNHCNSLPVEC